MKLRENGTISVSIDLDGIWEICVKNDRNVGSFGIFFGDNPFDFTLPATLLQLIFVLLASRTLYFILRPLKTPKFICSILSGILLGPSFLGKNKLYWHGMFPARQAEVLVMMSILGSIFFLFIIALKMDILMTLRGAKSTWKLGVISFLASYAVIAILLNFCYHPQNFPHLQLIEARSALSAAMAFSNFPVVSEALTELNLLSTELGQIALSSATFNDCIQFFLIVCHHLLGAEGRKHMVAGFVSWFVFILFSIYIVRPTMKLIARKTPLGEPVPQIYVVFILLGVLVMAGLTDMIGVTTIIGPVIYGLVIPSGPPLGSTLVEKSEIIITEVLLPFFSIFIGLNTNLYAVFRNWQEFVTLQLILIAGDVAKVISCVLVSLTYDIKVKHGAVLGLMLNIKGITHLIAFTKLRKIKILDEETFSHMVICVVVTTTIVTPLVKVLYKHRPRVLNSSDIFDQEMKTIQNSPRDLEFRIVTCVYNEGNVRGLTALLEACNPIPESPLTVFVIHLIELLGQSAPILLPINYKQNRKFLSVNYPNTNHIMRAFENYSNNSSGPVTILPYVNVAPYKSMHHAVCTLAVDKMVPFLIIPFHENDNIDLAGHMSTSTRKLNARFQERAPCTLGILVDRYSRLGANKDKSKPYFHVAIFFIGGADDREALALGIRMSERPDMKVSLFRFLVASKKLFVDNDKNQLEAQEEAEEMLDEGLIDEFKGRKIACGNVFWYEIVVEDGVEIMDTIRTLEGDYDLVMVGRHHKIGSLNDVEMGNFIESAQILGLVGDMLSSTEFCIGMVPVLVTQSGGNMVTSKLDRVGSINVSNKSFKA